MKPLNLTGQKFGRLTISKRIGSKSGKSYWFGCCECGGTAQADSSNLQKGNVTSCGCFRREFIRGNQLPEGESGFNGLFGRYQKRAKQDGIQFTLTKTDFKKLTVGYCYYCGAPPSQSISSRRSGKGRYSYNGIDRMDSAEGYVLGNCVPACKTCNYMKLEMSIEDFITACKKVVEHSKIYG